MRETTLVSLRQAQRGWALRTESLRMFLSCPERYLSLVDQGVAAVCRFAAIVVFARLLSADEFGPIAIAISVAYLCVGFARATFSLPFAAFCSDAKEMSDDGHMWFTFSIFLAALAGAMSALAALTLFAFGSPSWLTHTAIYSTMLSPTTMFYEFSRRWLFQRGHYRALLNQVIAFAAMSAAGFLVVFILPFPLIAATATSVAYCLAMLVGLVHNLPRARLHIGDVAQIWRKVNHFTRWTIVEYIADSIHSYGMNLAVVFFAGPVGASVFAATRNVVAPVYTLMSALSAEMPGLTREYSLSGARGLTKALRSTQLFALIIAGPYVVLMAVFSEPLLLILYGTKYAGLSTELKLWALAALLFIIVRPLDMWLLASLDSKTLFKRKMLGAVMTIVVAIPLLPLWGVKGALYAIVAGMVVNMVGLWIAVYGPMGRRTAKTDGTECRKT